MNAVAVAVKIFCTLWFSRNNVYIFADRFVRIFFESLDDASYTNYSLTAQCLWSFLSVLLTPDQNAWIANRKHDNNSYALMRFDQARAKVRERERCSVWVIYKEFPKCKLTHQDCILNSSLGILIIACVTRYFGSFKGPSFWLYNVPKLVLNGKQEKVSPLLWHEYQRNDLFLSFLHIFCLFVTKILF